MYFSAYLYELGHASLSDPVSKSAFHSIRKDTGDHLKQKYTKNYFIKYLNWENNFLLESYRHGFAYGLIMSHSEHRLCHIVHICMVLNLFKIDSTIKNWFLLTLF